MPDVDRLFRALQHDADLVPSPELYVVRELGRRRRLRHTTAVLITVGLLVGAVVAVPALTPRRTPPPADVRPTVTFMPLRPIGNEEITIGEDATGQVMATAIADGRGYTVWQNAEGMPTVAALDIATGRRRWGPITLEPVTGWVGIFARAREVAVASGAELGGEAAITVLDPATGERLWRRTIRFSDALGYESAVVFTDQSTGTTEVIDWHSGRTLWTATDPSGSLATVLGMRVSQDFFFAATRSASMGDVSLPYTDHRLIEIGGDGIARVYDVHTGQLLGSRPALGNEALAFNGLVFAVRDSTVTIPNQILSYQAIGRDAPRTIYQSPHGSPRLRSLTPCGARRICLIEGYGTDNGAGAEVVAIDIDRGGSSWRTQSGNLDSLTPMGEFILGRTEDGLVGIYGAGQAAFLAPHWSPDVADRVDDGNVLLLRSATGGDTQRAEDTAVLGVRVATGEQLTLGRIRIWARSCSWDTRFLLCATSTGFQVWQFGAD